MSKAKAPLKTLDTFFPAYTKKPVTTPEQENILTDTSCHDCKKKIKVTGMRYTLTIKGKPEDFCADCARARLDPLRKPEDRGKYCPEDKSNCACKKCPEEVSEDCENRNDPKKCCGCEDLEGEGEGD
jgi:hypothetical protein